MSIGTRSFGTSPGACDARNGNSSRRFRWTPRRRSWSARSRTRAAPGARRSRRSGYRVHDFVIPATATTGGKPIPYGIYDLHRNEGWVSVGIDHDTASFAVRSIQRWWQHMGRPAYRQAQSLLITADAGGSNGARLRLWKWELQRLANRTGLVITVCHFPPGTSKWNKIEHRLFSHIAMNWRGTPLVDLATIVSLIASTHSRSRTPRSVGTRPRPISGWHHRHRCAAGDGTPRAASLSRRLDLHDPSRCSENTTVSNCLTSPKPCSPAARGSRQWASSRR